MDHEVVFIKKVRKRGQQEWAYLSNNLKGTFSTPDTHLSVQFGIVVERLVAILGADVTVISPQLTAEVREDMEVLFPDTTFMSLQEPNILTFFERAYQQGENRRRPNPATLYIASDASGGHMNVDGSGHVPAAWAWCSDGQNGQYDFGYSGMVNVNVAEVEGIMHAVIAHRDVSSPVHLYCDSVNAIEMLTFDIMEGIVPREARKHGLTELAEETIEAAKGMNLTAEWVRGHRKHRLNMIADSISRHARKKFSSGAKREQFIREVDAMYMMFNRDS